MLFIPFFCFNSKRLYTYSQDETEPERLKACCEILNTNETQWNVDPDEIAIIQVAKVLGKSFASYKMMTDSGNKV